MAIQKLIYFFKVHVRTWKCGKVSCNCGVAAQEGDDVIVIDMCHHKGLTVRFASNVEPRATIERDADGKRFKVF